MDIDMYIDMYIEYTGLSACYTAQEPHVLDGQHWWLIFVCSWRRKIQLPNGILWPENLLDIRLRLPSLCCCLRKNRKLFLMANWKLLRKLCMSTENTQLFPKLITFVYLVSSANAVFKNIHLYKPENVVFWNEFDCNVNNVKRSDVKVTCSFTRKR